MTRRILALSFILALPTGSYAQAPPASDPEKQAIGSMLMEAMQREAAARTQVFTLQSQVEALKAAAAKTDKER